MMLSDVCLTTSVSYILKIHGAHSYWKQGVRCVWAVAGPQRAAYKAGHIVAIARLHLVIIIIIIVCAKDIMFFALVGLSVTQQGNSKSRR